MAIETRRLGRTGHDSTVLTFGAIALSYVEQDEANRLVENVLSHGVNHFDVAPTYGDAEEKLGPKLEQYRDEVFLGCKTQERDREGAREEMEQSLENLRTDRFDLYQFHAVVTQEDVDQICEDGGALEAVEAAREEGTLDHVGVTSHGDPEVIREAIERIDPDTVMFPMNAVVNAREDVDYGSVVELAEERDVGTIGIKAFAKRPWETPEDERPYANWYEPFDEPEEVALSLRYALSQGLTSLASAGDPQLLPMMLHAAERFEELSPTEQRELERERADLDTPVPQAE